MNAWLRAVGFAALAAGWSLAQDSWERPARVTGEVHDQDGAPVAGAEVVLRPLAGRLSSNVGRLSLFDPPLAIAQTNLEGRFSLDLPMWTTLLYAELVLVAMAEDCSGAAYHHVYPFSRSSHKASFQLARLLDPTSVEDECRRGRLVDPSGRPIARSRVVSLATLECWARTRVVALHETTDADGRFRLPPTGVGFTLIVERGDLAIPISIPEQGGTLVVPAKFEASTSGSDGSVDLSGAESPLPDADTISAALRRRAEDHGEVTGIVLGPGGRPLPGAEVVALPPDASLDLLASVGLDQRRPREPFARTDLAGRFRIRHLGPGAWRLQTAAPHLAPVLGPILRVEDERPTTVASCVLRPGASLSIRGTGGRPFIQDAECTSRVYLSFDSPEGVVDGLPPGLLTVGSWTTGCCAGPHRDVAIPKSGSVTVDFDEEPPRPDPRRQRRAR